MLTEGLDSICLEGQQILGYVSTIIVCSLEFGPDCYRSFLSVPCGRLDCHTSFFRQAQSPCRTDTSRSFISLGRYSVSSIHRQAFLDSNDSLVHIATFWNGYTQEVRVGQSDLLKQF